MKDSQQGFTLVELVVVLVLLAIVSAFAMPKFFDLNLYSDRTAYDETVSAMRYAQKLAVSSGCEVQVQLTSSGYALQQHGSSCTAGNFAIISTQHPLSSASFSDASISSSQTNFVFDSMGRCSAPVSVSVGSYNFSIIAETGYVDAL